MLRIGDAELGNWGSSPSGDLTPIRNLSGRMDEFIPFRSALAPRDIAEAYERERPD